MYCRDAYEKKISSKKKPSKPKKMKKPVPIGDVSIASSCQYNFIFVILKSYRTRFNLLSCSFLAHHGTLTQNHIKIPPSRKTNQLGQMLYKNQRNKQNPNCHKHIG